MKTALPKWIENLYENLFLAEDSTLGRRVLTSRRSRLIYNFDNRISKENPSEMLKALIKAYLMGSVEFSVVDTLLSINFTVDKFLNYDCEELQLIPRIGAAKIRQIQGFQEQLKQGR